MLRYDKIQNGRSVFAQPKNSICSPDMLGFLNDSPSDKRQRQRRIDEKRCNMR